MKESLLAGWQPDDGVDRLKRGMHAQGWPAFDVLPLPGRGTKTQKIGQKKQARPLVGRLSIAPLRTARGVRAIRDAGRVLTKTASRRGASLPPVPVSPFSSGDGRQPRAQIAEASPEGNSANLRS